MGFNLFSLLHLDHATIMDDLGSASGVDMDYDGIPDTLEPFSHLGNTSGVDLDHDGIPDALEPFSQLGNASGVDLDHDGIPDALEPFNHIGNASGVDLDHDGIPDALEPFNHIGGVTQSVGDITDSEHWNMQEAPFSCAVAAQKGVIESITGQEIPEDTLAREAMTRGWYDPLSGTKTDAMSNLLELHGVSADTLHGLSIVDLAEALDKGEKVIAAVDSAEGTGLPTQGHAVWVTGIQQDSSNEWSVVLNDPGVPDGAGKIMSVDNFLNAWNDFGNTAAITETTGGIEGAA